MWRDGGWWEAFSCDLLEVVSRWSLVVGCLLSWEKRGLLAVRAMWLVAFGKFIIIEIRYLLIDDEDIQLF